MIEFLKFRLVYWVNANTKFNASNLEAQSTTRSNGTAASNQISINLLNLFLIFLTQIIVIHSKIFQIPIIFENWSWDVRELIIV